MPLCARHYGNGLSFRRYRLSSRKTYLPPSSEIIANKSAWLFCKIFTSVALDAREKSHEKLFSTPHHTLRHPYPTSAQEFYTPWPKSPSAYLAVLVFDLIPFIYVLNNFWPGFFSEGCCHENAETKRPEPTYAFHSLYYYYRFPCICISPVPSSPLFPLIHTDNHLINYLFLKDDGSDTHH